MANHLDLQEVMKYHRFLVVGDTRNPDKYAYRIAGAMSDAGYQVTEGGRSPEDVNLAGNSVDIVDLCINGERGLEYMQHLTVDYHGVVIQPGAETLKLLTYLEDRGIPYLEGCLLVGLRLYPGEQP